MTKLDTKEKINAWLKRQYNISKFTIHRDLSVSAIGDMDLSRQQLKTIPVRFRDVVGTFRVNGNLLTSLDNAPEHVSNMFLCDYNKLTSLVGGPQSAKFFSCSHNRLTSLMGAPTAAPDFFNCDHNQLITLEGCPQSVVQEFDGSYNQLKNLVGAPQIMGHNFDVRHNALTSLFGAPRSVGGNFYCCHNSLTDLQHATSEVKLSFLCENNRLNTLRYLPDKVGGSFFCEGNPQLGDVQEIKDFAPIYQLHLETLQIEREKEMLNANVHPGTRVSQHVKRGKLKI